MLCFFFYVAFWLFLTFYVTMIFIRSSAGAGYLLSTFQCVQDTTNPFVEQFFFLLLRISVAGGFPVANALALRRTQPSFLFWFFFFTDADVSRFEFVYCTQHTYSQLTVARSLKTLSIKCVRYITTSFRFIHFSTFIHTMTRFETREK